jgi:serine O-acetyltransferase
MKYINSKPDLQRFLETECKKYNQHNIRAPFIAISEGKKIWKFAVILRRTEYYLNTNKRIRKRIYGKLLSYYQNKFFMHIPVNCFDCGLKIMHLGPILVNSKAEIGKNCSIHINTGIVAGGTNSDCPVLGDGIVIGMGAVILGNVRLADNIAVGANAVVNKSFDEENIGIAGVPARKISNNGRLQWGNKGPSRGQM